MLLMIVMVLNRREKIFHGSGLDSLHQTGKITDMIRADGSNAKFRLFVIDDDSFRKIFHKGWGKGVENFPDPSKEPERTLRKILRKVM